MVIYFYTFLQAKRFYVYESLATSPQYTLCAKQKYLLEEIKNVTRSYVDDEMFHSLVSQISNVGPETVDNIS